MSQSSERTKHISPNEATEIFQLIKQFYPISKSIESYIIKHTYASSIKRGKILIPAGEICDNIFFIKKGALRAFVKEGKKEFTTWITIENEMITAITSFNLQAPALENIQAIEDSELLFMNYKDLQELYKTFPEYNIVGRKVYEKYYWDAEIRAIIGRISKAEKKYEYFLKMHPFLANRVPLKYIASYLGISLETLSRIRSQKVSNKKYSLTIVK